MTVQLEEPAKAVESPLPKGLFRSAVASAIEAVQALDPFDFEFANVPIYTFDQAELPRKHFAFGEDGYAWTAGLLDLELQQLISQRGRGWEGRGPVVVFDTRALWLGAPTRSSFIRKLMAICVHEICHWLALPEDIALEDREELEEVEGPICLGYTKGQAAICEQSKQPRWPWEWHRMKFIRACAHMAYRSEAEWLDFTPSEMQFAGAEYGLSHGRCYMNAFGSELEERREESIRKILQRDYPPAALQLWRDDTAAYKQAYRLRQQSRKEHAA